MPLYSKPYDRGGIDGHERKVNDMNTYWRLSAPLLTALFLIPSVAADTASTPTGLVSIDVYADFNLYCEGEVTYQQTATSFRATLVEIGPIKIGSVRYARWSIVGSWSYTCRAREQYGAFGYGGALREVEIQHDRDQNGVFETVARCNYIVGGCSAWYSTSSRDIYSERGFSTGYSGMPSSVSGCIDRWLRGSSTQYPVPGTILDTAVDAHPRLCRTASIYWTVNYGSGFNFPFPGLPDSQDVQGAIVNGGVV